MSRFLQNRRMTLVLALVACLIAAPQLSAPAHAIWVAEDPGSGNDDTGGGGSPRGDPDVPVGPYRAGRMGIPSGGTTTLANRTVGDGSVTSVAWMWRLRIVVQSLRAYYLHF